ncbi:hypothetical protein MHZ90_22065 [Pantoea sp. ACRSH]|nr:MULTISPECIES: DUF5405 family protein [unclassified Pantoea]MCG7368773.1 hypothetical protein [Pantoea sp. ACRSH]MCG7399153.1 hypothetical protein [Pantoea sp. ACRSC]
MGYPQTNRKTDTGKTLTRWPVFVDHFKEKKVVKEGKNAGGEYLSLVGYFPKLSQAIAGLIHLDVQMSDVQSLQEMEQHIRRVSEQCELAIKEAV